jgi:transcriptional regulator with XRE-family HTH domain
VKVGAKIQRLRKARGLATPVLALRAGVSRMHMYRIERDAISPTLGTLARVAKALGVKVRDLID